MSAEVFYDVTGVDVYGKRFLLRYSDIRWAMGINLHRGSVWKVTNGKRKLLRRVFN